MIRRGLSTATAGALIFSLLVLVFIPFLSYLLSLAIENQKLLSSRMSLESLKLAEAVDADIVHSNGKWLLLRNVGSVELDFRYILVRDLASGKLIVLDIYSYSKDKLQFEGRGTKIVYGDEGYVALYPGSAIRIPLEDSWEPLLLITCRGNIINLEELIKSKRSSEAESVVSNEITFSNIASLNDLFERKDLTVFTVVNTTTGEVAVGEKAKKIFSVNATYRSGGGLKLYREYNNVNLLFDASIYGTAIIGLYPKDSSKYSILIAGAKLECYTDNNDIVLTTPQGDTLSIGCDFLSEPKGGFRILIEGFSGYIHVEYGLTDENAEELEYVVKNASNSEDPKAVLGFYAYGFGMKDDRHGYGWLYLYLNGKADRVLIYRATSEYHNSSIEPYILFADIDGNDLPEFIFTTEDVRPGEGFSIDDAIRWSIKNYKVEDLAEVFKKNDDLRSCVGTDDEDIIEQWLISKIGTYKEFKSNLCLLADSGGSGEYTDYVCTYDLRDYTVYPVYIMLKSIPIPSEKYAEVIVTMRVYYHDSALDDLDDFDSPGEPLLGVYLGKIDNGRLVIVASREFTVSDLSVSEITWLPGTNWVTFTVSLPVPLTGDTYYLILMFRDPYLRSPWCILRNDIEFTIAVEFVSIIKMAR